EFRYQGQVVIDTVEERNTTSFEVGSRTQSVAIILGLTVGQCHAVLAEAVGALEQVAIAVNFPQLRLTDISGEERVDSFSLKARCSQRKGAHLRLHTIANAFGIHISDAAIGVIRALLHAAQPGVKLSATCFELVGNLCFETWRVLVSLVQLRSWIGRVIRNS